MNSYAPIRALIRHVRLVFGCGSMLELFDADEWFAWSEVLAVGAFSALLLPTAILLSV